MKWNIAEPEDNLPTLPLPLLNPVKSSHPLLTTPWDEDIAHLNLELLWIYFTRFTFQPIYKLKKFIF